MFGRPLSLAWESAIAQGRKEKYLALGVIDVMQCKRRLASRVAPRRVVPKGSCTSLLGTCLLHRSRIVSSPVVTFTTDLPFPLGCEATSSCKGGRGSREGYVRHHNGNGLERRPAEAIRRPPCPHGMTVRHSGLLDAALRHLRHASSLSPTDVNTLVAIGVALGRQGKWDEAVPVLERAAAIDSSNPWAQRNLGACLLQVGRQAQGERALRKAVEISPGDQQVLYGLAEALLAAGDEEGADKL